MEKAPLFEEDENLFKDMVGNYQSENERFFFETQKRKQEYEPVGTQDVLCLGNMNDDNLYFYREGYSEYFIDPGCVHTMTLAEALNTNLKEIGALDRDITMLQWLRERDYEGIHYDLNYDKE